MFFVIEGNLEVIDDAGGGKVIGVLGPGDYAGEMSVLLEAKRTKTLRAKLETDIPVPGSLRGDGSDLVQKPQVVVCVLLEEQLFRLEDDYPEIVSNMRNLAAARMVGNFNLSEKLDDIEAHHKAADHGNGNRHDDHGGHAHGLIPGMGEKPDHGHGHSHGGEHEFAAVIWSKTVSARFTIFNEFTLLMNCFFTSFYLIRVGIVIIPATEAPTAVRIGMNFLCFAPTCIIMAYLSPMCAKYQCLLMNVLYRDDELIAQVNNEMTKILALRKKIRTTLMDSSLMRGLTQDKDATPSMSEVAESAFESIDKDGDGSLAYAEFKLGLTEFGIYLTKREFKNICRMIDPDGDGALDRKEWMDFMQATDESIESNDWQGALNAAKLRSNIKDALLLPALQKYYETAPPGAPTPDITTVVVAIFEELDDDGNGQLDYDEFKAGLEARNLNISDDQYKKMYELVDVNASGQLDLAEFQNFMSVADEDLARADAEAAAEAALQSDRKPIPSAFEVEGGNGSDNPTDPLSNPLARGSVDPEIGSIKRVTGAGDDT